MTIWQQWTHEIAQRVSQALGEPVESTEIIVPPDTTLGDFAFASFKYAKTRGLSPVQLAHDLAKRLATQPDETMKFVAVGPYVNVIFEGEGVMSQVLTTVLDAGQTFGHHPVTTKEGSIMIEYANPNTHKEIHIGHLRNFVTGRAFVALLRAAGERVVPVSYINDQGANVAKTLWWMLTKAALDLHALTSDDVQKLCHSISVEQKTGRYLGQLYTEATRLSDAQTQVAGEVAFVQAQLEAHDPAYEELWRVTRDWCLDELRNIFQELGVTVDKIYLESDFIDRAREVVNELESKQVAVVSQGALIINLEADKLGVVLIRKTDGNLLYVSKDLALAEAKIHDYSNIRQAYTVVDHRQNLYFRQLGRVLELLGYKQSFSALCYALVRLQDGSMSSRTGNIVTYQDLRDAVIDYASSEIRRRHSEIDVVEVQKRAKDLAYGGIIFAMLKQDPDKIFTFDMEQALSFDGATGPYCQYAVTRLNSILKKADRSTQAGVLSENIPVVEQAQKHLALTIAALPEKVRLAAQALKPSIVAQWCLDMAQAINAFYRDVPVLSATEPQRTKRLSLVTASKTALTNGLALLGIPTPDEM